MEIVFERKNKIQIGEWGYFWNDDVSKYVYGQVLKTPSLDKPFYFATNFNVDWKNFSRQKPKN
jgi:hypothetical protein